MGLEDLDTTNGKGLNGASLAPEGHKPKRNLAAFKINKPVLYAVAFLIVITGAVILYKYELQKPKAEKVRQMKAAELQETKVYPAQANSAAAIETAAKAGKVKKAKKNKSLNDLFRLKTAAPNGFSTGVPVAPYPSAPNFNGLPPMFRNIKSNRNYGGAQIAVVGVSNGTAAVKYGNNLLYLKSGSVFGRCTVLSISVNNVKISCRGRTKDYPVLF